MRDLTEFYNRYWRFRKKHSILYEAHPLVRFEEAIRLMGPLPAPPISILDVGCGEGTLGKLIREKIKKDVYLVGLDVSDEIVDLASKYYDEIHLANVELQDFKAVLGDKKFDYIVLLEILEHLFEPEQVLKKMKPFLKKEGRALVSFPNFAFYKNRLTVFRGRFPSESQHVYSDCEHIHYYTLDSFTKLIEGSGYRLEDIGGHFYLPRPLRLLPQPIRRRIYKRWPSLFGLTLILKASLK